MASNKRNFAMFRRLFFRSAATLPSSGSVEKPKMASPRYLINNLPDYNTNLPKVEIPNTTIYKQIFKYVDDIEANFEATEKNATEGLYLGTAGVAYMFYHLSKIELLAEHKQRFLESAIKYLEPALKVCRAECNHSDIPAFMLGNCGVYAVATAIYHEMGNEEESLVYRDKYNESAVICKEMNYLSAGSDELFVGRAGYLCGALWMSKQTGQPFKNEDIFDICRIIITSGKEYASSLRNGPPLMYSYYNVEYIGAGHGISSILQMLMSVPGYLQSNALDARDIKKSVDFVLSLQDKEGNFPAATDEAKNSCNKLVHWCHGASGCVYLMAKAYLIWSDKKYLHSCERAAELIWQKGLLKKGPGLCHGIAGNGYVFLLLYRLTQDPKYLFRAVQFCLFLNEPTFQNNSRVPDSPYSLFEGIAGTVCYLADLLEPKKAAFPFSDVF